MKQIGVQYTIFKKGGGFRQAYYNARPPILFEIMTEGALIDACAEIIKDLHPDDMILIDAIKRDGPVHSIHDFEA